MSLRGAGKGRTKDMRVKKYKGFISLNLSYSVWKQQLCSSLYNHYFPSFNRLTSLPTFVHPKGCSPSGEGYSPPVSLLECASREAALSLLPSQQWWDNSFGGITGLDNSSGASQGCSNPITAAAWLGDTAESLTNNSAKTGDQSPNTKFFFPQS